jgi:hypothetical protein
MRPGSTAATRVGHAVRRVMIVLAAASAVACGTRGQTQGPGGPLSKMGTDRYMQKAIRSSNEGVILLPSSKAERVYELPRLTEIAHALREPAAACFLLRAIETMEPVADERGFVKVPEGQVKIRTRIAPSGEVLSTEVLESGFTDTHMPECVSKAIEKQTFPQNRGGVAHYVDIVYWVSLGLQSDVHTEGYRDQLRREQAAAGVRGRPCLRSRVPPGHYRIDGLNLVDRDGITMINRVDAPALDAEVRACLSQALRDLRLAPQGDAFVRPVVATIEVDVDNDGAVTVKDEQWLHLIELEEEALRAAKQAAARGEDGDDGDPAIPIVEVDPIDDGEGVDLGPRPDDPQNREDPAAPERPATPPAPKQDPGTGGLKIELGPRRQ